MNRIALLALCASLSSPVWADGLLDLALSTNDPAKAPATIAKLEREGGERSGLYVGIVLHNVAGNDSGRVEKSIAALKDYWTRKGDPLALAYYGSAVTMRGGVLSAKGDFIKAAAAVDEGFGLMDKAVSLAPADLEIRLLRAENGMSVAESSPFKRYDVVGADLAALETKLGSLDPETRAQWWLISARLAQARGKNLEAAIAAYENAIRAAPSSGHAAAAKKRLALLEE
jgi:tetratricopeptide (TPR) repeat protein